MGYATAKGISKRGFMLRKRCTAIFFTFFAMFVLLLLRVFYFQICAGKSLLKAAISQRTANFDIEKPRGDILDRNLIPLTNRSRKYSIVLMPIYLNKNKENLRKVCEILDLDFGIAIKEMESRSSPIFYEVDKERKEKIAAFNLYGVSVINSLKRYDESSVAKHIVGYLNGVDGFGEAGIEKYYEDVLKYKGEDAVGIITDARSNPVQGLGYRLLKLDGYNDKLNIKLTLDYHIQKIVEDVMDRRGITGAVVVEDVCSGDVVAMASKPDFKQDRVASYLNSPGKELFNRAAASYNLGSIFKIIVAASILESGESIGSNYYCTGAIEAGGRMFRCSSYKKGGHGFIDLREAFAQSCNTYFINAGITLGYGNLINMAGRFGLGKTTGVNRQGVEEASGNLPSASAYYSAGDIANISIGQGEIMATPLQVADMTATIANGGIRNRVNIADSVVDNSGKKVRDLKNVEGKRVVAKETADAIKSLMEEVTETGTGKKAALKDYGGAAGKTGSAETGEDNVIHAWFAGYFPRRNPRYSIAVFAEGGRSGGDVAAPVFAEIAEEIMKKGF